MVQVLDSKGLGFTHEEVIKICSVPMRVGNGVVRAGGDKEFVTVIRLRRPWLAKLGMEKGEDALKATRNFRVAVLPCSPFSERQQTREVIARGEFFDEEISQ